MATLWKCVAEPSGNPPGPAHYTRTTHARTSDKIDATAVCATLSSTRPFHFVHNARALQCEREMLASTCLYSLYAWLVLVEQSTQCVCVCACMHVFELDDL